ncbi:TPA: ImmA/IrrE family metallo-endopeptidase [Streptococcus suis]
MTEQDIIKEFNIIIHDFDGDLLPDEQGFFKPDLNVVFLSDKLTKKERLKVLLHELGHKNHSLAKYKHARIRCENEADRNMIHYLIKDAIKQIDDPKEFNYLNFMKYYNLTTMTEEIMVKEEYNNLLTQY